MKNRDKMKTELTQARLQELLHYDSKTGVFTNRVTRSNRATSGTTAGTLHINKQTSYRSIRIGIDGKDYSAHRLAWLYIYGELPPVDKEIDHINNNSLDNRLHNLRVCSRSDNMNNTKIGKRNTSGFMGVSKNRSKWKAQHGYRNENDMKCIKCIGTYPTALSAAVARWNYLIDLGIIFESEPNVVLAAFEQ